MFKIVFVQQKVKQFANIGYKNNFLCLIGWLRRLLTNCILLSSDIVANFKSLIYFIMHQVPFDYGILIFLKILSALLVYRNNFLN